MFDDGFIVREAVDKPIGYPPTNDFVRKALENLYISIVGAIDLGDFDTFLKESADLTYSEAKDKMIREYGTPKELSEARLKAKTAESEAKLEIAEKEALAEQKTIEKEFAELEETARKRLTENFEMIRRNEELEREVKHLREELARKAAPPAAPPGVPAPPVPAAPPAAHGSMYQEYRKRISEVTTIAEINDLASEIFDIAEREEYGKLTKGDIAELLEDLRKTGERRAIKLAEMKLPEIKPKIRKVPPMEREREAVPFIGVLPPQVMHRYLRPDIEEAAFAGERFIIDHELVRTIIRNNLLLFPQQWYALPHGEKIRRYGWDLASAFKHAVTFLHKYSWEDLEEDYGIPKKYIDAWRS